MNIKFFLFLSSLSFILIRDFSLIIKTWLFSLFVCIICNVLCMIFKSDIFNNISYTYKKGDIVIFKDIGRYHERYIKCEIDSCGTNKKPFRKVINYNLKSTRKPDITYTVKESDIVGLYSDLRENPNIKDRII